MEGAHFGDLLVAWNMKYEKTKLKTNQNSKRERNHEVKDKRLRRQI